MGERAIRLAAEAALTSWSLVIQMAVVLVFAAVFLSFWVFSKRRAPRTLFFAWAADSVALLMVLAVVALFSPPRASIGALISYTCYGVFKVAFASLLLLGIVEQGFGHREATRWLRGFVICSPAVLIPTSVFILRDEVLIQLLVFTVVGLLLLGYGLRLLSNRPRGATMLATGAAALHGLLFLHHAAVLFPWLFKLPVPSYMSHISFVDAISELLVGLACLLMLAESVLEEVRQTNRMLEETQRVLRELVDVDPLTGLYNRRRLRQFVSELKIPFGTLLYIDIDSFKKINDRWGHAVGDDCLRRLALSLRRVFRSTDGLFRLGGDEFLVVAPGLKKRLAQEKLEHLKALLSKNEDGAIRFSVSAGAAEFGQEKGFDEAMQLADAEMYRQKRRVKQA